MIAEHMREAHFLRQISVWSTTIFVIGLVLTYIALPSDSAEHVFSIAAIGIGLSLLAATTLEGTSGVRGLIRVDILMLWVLYGLTFLEFLFPQADVSYTVSVDSISPEIATKGTAVAMVAFAGIAIGRLILPSRYRRHGARVAEVTPRQIFFVFLISALFGYLPMLLAVKFDLLEMLRQMSLPRFAQSWQRGRYGDAYALLWEVGALLYLVPPIAGVVFARPKEYSVAKKIIVAFVFLFTIYYGFSSGTRNVLAVYTISFFGAYYLNRPSIKWWQVAVQGTAALALLLGATSYMLEFRNVGMSDFSFSDTAPTSLYIDHNMVVLSKLTNAFPDMYDFLGLEVPFNALVHPIPRALWPGKPEGLSVSVELIVGADQATTTIACTFIGEAYMMGGMLGVAFVAIAFGAAAEKWNRLSYDSTSAFSQLLYASGFFCAAISMRSMQWTTVTMLPALALWLFSKVWVARRPTNVPAGLRK